MVLWLVIKGYSPAQKQHRFFIIWIIQSMPINSFFNLDAIPKTTWKYEEKTYRAIFINGFYMSFPPTITPANLHLSFDEPIHSWNHILSWNIYTFFVIFIIFWKITYICTFSSRCSSFNNCLYCLFPYGIEQDYASSRLSHAHINFHTATVYVSIIPSMK